MNRSEQRKKAHQQVGHLSRLRDGWDAVEAEKTRLLRRLTVRQSLHDLLTLQEAFEPQLKLTESLFRAERLNYLRDLQRRLLKLAEWMRDRRGSPV